MIPGTRSIVGENVRFRWLLFIGKHLGGAAGKVCPRANVFVLRRLDGALRRVMTIWGCIFRSGSCTFMQELHVTEGEEEKNAWNSAGGR